MRSLFKDLILMSCLLFGSVFVWTNTALAGPEMYQKCRIGIDCIIGDYIFDNQGAPITSNICTINIRNPAGTLVVTDGTMTGNSDGWHYYTSNITSPTGLYRAVVYCDNSGDTGYLNKSFYVGLDIEDIESDVASLEIALRTVNDYDLGDIITYVDTIETVLGASTDPATATTVFGRIQKVQDRVDALTTVDAKIDTIIDKWGTRDAEDIYDEARDLSSEIDDINVVSDVEDILDLSKTDKTNTTELRNLILAMKSLVQVNRELLEKATTQPVIKTWLEEGSIVFRSLLTNPSFIVSQTASLDYYLPKEIKEEDIIKIDEGLKADYDADEGAYRITGEFTLEPDSSKIVAVETQDIWIISDEELLSIKNQVEELIKPLSNTSNYAQGALLKADIDSSLDKVQRFQQSAVTPQGKIRAYREAHAELMEVNTKVDLMKNLVASTGSAKTLFGFIGGVQTFAVWGILIVLISGFVFLALYMKTIRSHEVPVREKVTELTSTKNVKNSIKRIFSNKS